MQQRHVILEVNVRASKLLTPCVTRAEPFSGHAHKRRKRSLDYNLQRVAVATTEHHAADSTDGLKRQTSTKEVNGKEVVLSGSDSNGHILEGQDAEYQNSKQWLDSAFPSYLQSKKDDFCQSWEEAMQSVDRKHTSVEGHHIAAVTSSNPVWQAIRKEAARDASREPLLSSFLYASILSHDNFLECLAFVLANRMSNPTTLATEYFDAFITTFSENDEIIQAALDDLQAVRERDPACGSYSNAILFYKGYQAIQVHRIAHCLWNKGQKISARALQSRVSEVFSMDIHPQAKFGKGILMDHGNGIVIGQTASIGNNVSILQNVTLGGTGKEVGDRHPKISDNVLIGAAATILGNIIIGKGAMVAAGSLVLKAVPRNTMVAGSPAKEIGCITGNPAQKMQHWLKEISPASAPFSQSFEDLLRTNSGKKSPQKLKPNPKPEALEGQAAERIPEISYTDPKANGPTANKAAESSAPNHQDHVQTLQDQREEHGSPEPEVEHLAGDVLQNGAASAKDNGIKPQFEKSHRQKAHDSHNVQSVRSDERASKLWPDPQEPEYYL